MELELASFRNGLAYRSTDSMTFAISTAIFHVKSFLVKSYFWMARFRGHKENDRVELVRGSCRTGIARPYFFKTLRNQPPPPLLLRSDFDYEN